MMSTMPDWKTKIAWIWRESPKVAAWRLPFALFACALLAYAAALAWHMLTSFDIVNFINANADDAYYYFQIAYNLAQGKFSTFDGSITQTNGYQPIWLLIITPFYWILDKEAALFGIKALEVALVAGGVVLIALAAWLARLAWLLLFAALPMLYRNPYELLWGMEAAAAIFMLALLILAACIYMRAPDRWKWHLAAVAFTLTWVRIEYIAISLAVTAALCAIEWSRLERRSLRLSALANIRQAYIPLVGAISGALVYFAYNGLTFGGILPVSAAIKQTWSQAKWAREGGYDFIENFQGTLQIGVFDYELLIALEICAYLLIAWQLALRSNDRRDWMLVAFLVGVFGLAAGHLAKFAQTVLIMHYIESNIWYFVPAYLLTALIIPVRLYIAILLIRRFIAPRWRTAANALIVCAAVIGATFLLGRAGFAAPFRWVDEESRSTKLDWDVASYMGAQVINRALPEDSVIGAWDAGIIGYFSRFPVVNMDGLVNSYAHFDIIRQRGLVLGKYASLADPQVVEISRRYGITHFANNRPLDDQINVISVMFESAPFDTQGFDERIFTIWTYDPAPETHIEVDYSQQVWDTIEPRFDHSANGLGVVLVGRTAQALAKDCAQDELLIWNWRGQQYERTVSLDVAPYRTRANICVSNRVLPRSAAQLDQAEMMTRSDYFANLTASREPIIRSDFEVYIDNGSLIYAKSQCGETDVEARFFANIFPVDANDLLEKYSHTQRSYDGIDFNFADYGAIAADRRCWAAVDLPDYPIAEIHTGQYVELEDGYVHIWEGFYEENAHRNIDLEG